MIPKTNVILNTEIKPEIQPSKNYKMHFSEERINGFWDKLSAMEQVIYKILNTKRYENQIYSWNYGIELDDLFGEPISFVCPEVRRRITEALTQDERINSVDEFDFNTSKKGVVLVSFTVHTIFGDINSERAVNV